MTAATTAPALVDPAGQIERLTKRLQGAEDALDRWCDYQDRIREILGNAPFAALRDALTEGGWVNESQCPHRVGAEMLPLILGLARLAKCEHTVERSDGSAHPCPGFLLVLYGQPQGTCTTCGAVTGYKAANYIEVVAR